MDAIVRAYIGALWFTSRSCKAGITVRGQPLRLCQAMHQSPVSQRQDWPVQSSGGMLYAKKCLENLHGPLIGSAGCR